MIEILYTVLSAATFWLLFTIWNRESWLNLLLKISFLAFAIFGTYLAFVALGYVPTEAVK